jgi:hypothetical protein
VTEPVVAESSAGSVEVEFGVNRWVMVTVDAGERQKQVSNERELGYFLRDLGLYPNEAEDVARKVWRLDRRTPRGIYRQNPRTGHCSDHPAGATSH